MANLKSNIPLRKCIGCNVSKPKHELIRVVKTPEGNIVLDTTGKANGRGAYICKTQECLNKAIKSNGLGRAFKMRLDKELLKKLGEEMTGLDT